MLLHGLNSGGALHKAEELFFGTDRSSKPE